MLVQVGHHHPKNITIIITVIAAITYALLGDSPSLSSSSPRHYQDAHCTKIVTRAIFATRWKICSSTSLRGATGMCRVQGKRRWQGFLRHHESIRNLVCISFLKFVFPSCNTPSVVKYTQSRLKVPPLGNVSDPALSIKVFL